MNKQVFISHSSVDCAAAGMVCAALEARGIACWIAPRDIPPGAEWPAAIISGIAEVQVLVLLHSASSAISKMILREVNAAVERRQTIIPIRIDTTTPCGAIQFFLGNTHWFDASKGALRGNLSRIVDVVLAQLSGQGPIEPPNVPRPSLVALDRPALAVLPFVNMSGNADHEYFADGVTEELITQLARARWFYVIARNSTFTYKNRPVDIRQIGLDLGVRYVLEGSVRRSSERVRIAGQLIEAETGHQIWADRFDGNLDDIFELQDKVAEAVAGVIEPSLQNAEVLRAEAKPTESLTAYDFYLKALPHHHKITRTGNDEALRILRQAIAADPSFTLVRALAAFCHSIRRTQSWHSDADTLEGIGFARDALAVNSDDPTTLRLAAHSIAFLAGDCAAGLQAIERALALNPNSGQVQLSAGMVYNYAARPSAAIAAFQRAIRLSPLDPEMGHMLTGMGIAHLQSQDPAQALVWGERAVLHSQLWITGLRVVIASKWLLGREDEARASAADLMRMAPQIRVRETLAPYRDPIFREAYGRALMAAGIPD